MSMNGYNEKFDCYEEGEGWYIEEMEMAELGEDYINECWDGFDD